MQSANIFLVLSFSLLYLIRKRVKCRATRKDKNISTPEIKKIAVHVSTPGIKKIAGHEIGHVINNIRITSPDYNRAVHHIEIMCDQEYNSGDCAGVFVPVLGRPIPITFIYNN